MLFLNWLWKRTRSTQSSKCPERTFRPSVEVLEDRTVPSQFGAAFFGAHSFFGGFGHHHGGGSTSTAVASQALVTTQEQAVVGSPTRVTVTILDASGHVVPNYTGTITLTSTDTMATGASARHATAASLPITYTFTAQDHGRHTFAVTFKTAEAAGTATTVNVSGTVPNSTTTPPATISGKATLTVFPATTATHFAIVRGDVTSTATAGRFGNHRSRAVAGTPVAVTVVALNAINQVVTGYAGTIGFTSSDTKAVVSATSGGTTSALSAFSYMFTAADNGKHAFFLTFNTSGHQSLTATDAAISSLLGSLNIRVKAAPTTTTSSSTSSSSVL